MDTYNSSYRNGGYTDEKKSIYQDGGNVDGGEAQEVPQEEGQESGGGPMQQIAQAIIQMPLEGKMQLYEFIGQLIQKEQQGGQQQPPQGQAPPPQEGGGPQQFKKGGLVKKKVGGYDEYHKQMYGVEPTKIKKNK